MRLYTGCSQAAVFEQSVLVCDRYYLDDWDVGRFYYFYSVGAQNRNFSEPGSVNFIVAAAIIIAGLISFLNGHGIIGIDPKRKWLLFGALAAGMRQLNERTSIYRIADSYRSTKFT